MEKNEKNNDKNYVEVLNLKEITKLINILGDTTDIDKFSESNINFNSRVYEFIKNDNCLIVKCSDGRNLEIKMNIDYVKRGSDVLYYYNTKLKNSVSDNDSIVINKTFTKGYNDSYKAFKENHFDYHDLVHGCEIGYTFKEDKNYHTLIWNEEDNIFNFKYGLDRLKDGYIYSTGVDKYILSSDLNKIISLNGNLLPDKEEIYKFNEKVEQAKIKDVIEKYQLNEITRNMLIQLINKLHEKSAFINQIKDAYEKTVIPKSKEILNQEQKINKEVINNMFSKEEIMFMSEVLKEIVKNRRKEIIREEEVINSINVVLNNLSLEELYNLKEQLENNNKVMK